MPDLIGPGHTAFIPNDDGSISVRRHNDPSWTTRFADAHTVQDEAMVAHLLARAYQMGMDDKSLIIKNAIGI